MSTTRRTILAGLAALPLAPASAGVTSPDTAILALRPRIAAAQGALDAACDRVAAADVLHFAGNPAPDRDAAKAEEEAAWRAWAELRDEILDMPATTLDGLMVKATFCPDPWEDSELMRSVVGDVLAISGGAA